MMGTELEESEIIFSYTTKQERGQSYAGHQSTYTAKRGDENSAQNKDNDDQATIEGLKKQLQEQDREIAMLKQEVSRELALLIKEDDDIRRECKMLRQENKEIRNLMKSIQRINNDPMNPVREQNKKPYPSVYDAIPYPSEYAVPIFKLFTGNNVQERDVDWHIACFSMACGKTAGNDVLMLRQFPSSLSGLAFEWYMSLEKDSIKTWDEMVKAFRARFSEVVITEALTKEGLPVKKFKATISAKADPGTRAPAGNSNPKAHSSGPTLMARKSKPYSFRKDKVAELFPLAMIYGLQLPICKRPNELQKHGNPKFCMYHRVVGHTIDNCYVFKDWVEEKYRAGEISLPEHVLQMPALHD